MSCSSHGVLHYRVGSSSGVKKDALEIFLKGEAPTFTIEKLLEARLIAPMAGSSDTYTLTDDARALPLKLGNPLNCHVEWYGTARSAVDVSGELRARILELYDAYLAQDGKAVDYEGMRGDARFDAYVDATVELTKVDLSQMSRNGTLMRPSVVMQQLMCTKSCAPMTASICVPAVVDMFAIKECEMQTGASHTVMPWSHACLNCVSAL